MAGVSYHLDPPVAIPGGSLRVLVRQAVSAGSRGRNCWFYGDRTPLAVIIDRAKDGARVMAFQPLPEGARAALAEAGISLPDPPDPAAT